MPLLRLGLRQRRGLGRGTGHRLGQDVRHVFELPLATEGARQDFRRQQTVRALRRRPARQGRDARRPVARHPGWQQRAPAVRVRDRHSSRGRRPRLLLAGHGQRFRPAPRRARVRAAAANLLRQDTSARGKSAYREIGEAVPQFVLYNQDGEVVPINRFRGKRVVMNFIYTRCPIATMCPASTQRMMALQQAAKARGVRDLELVSITLDPAYDTSPVLKDYASVRGIDTGNFSFPTGPEGTVRDLLLQFGIIVEPGENYLKHTL
ncbi:MAG: SCO family protein, partial [Opitutae bacterium]|nr:SCO family protein [Opitutae bacterium]